MSRCVSVFIVVLFLTHEASAQMCADCDGNGQVSVLDSLVGAQIAAAILAPTASQMIVCDVDDSAVVTILDALRMSQAAAGLAPVLVCPGDPPNDPPVVAGVLALAPFMGAIQIDYTLSDTEGNGCSLEVEVSMDGGATFPLTATDGPGGDGRGSLGSSPGGTAHSYVWDTVPDLGTGVTPNVVVRLTATDAVAGTPGDSQTFTVDNTALQTPPEVMNVNPILPFTGNLSVDYLLLDQESDMCQITVEISIDGGATFVLTATDGPGGEGRTGLASSPGGLVHSYVWDSVADLGATLTTGVVIRITPMDGQAGAPGSSAPIDVDNQVPVSFAMDIHPTIQGAVLGGLGCLASSCHDAIGPSAGLNLTSYAQMMAGSVGGPVVIPGDPDMSRIICKLSGTACGTRMPRLGTPWSAAMIQTFRDWISQGALDN